MLASFNLHLQTVHHKMPTTPHNFVQLCKFLNWGKLFGDQQRHPHTGKLLDEHSKLDTHFKTLAHTHTHPPTHIHLAVARQPRPSDMRLTEIVSTVLWLPLSLSVSLCVRQNFLWDGAGPWLGSTWPERGRETFRRSGGKQERMKRMSSEGGEGLIKGNICKPEGSYVNGLVIKAFWKRGGQIGARGRRVGK